MLNPVMIYGFSSNKKLESFNEVGRTFYLNGHPVYTLKCLTIRSTMFSRIHATMRLIELEDGKSMKYMDDIAKRVNKEANWMMALDDDCYVLAPYTSETVDFDDWVV